MNAEDSSDWMGLGRSGVALVLVLLPLVSSCRAFALFCHCVVSLRHVRVQLAFLSIRLCPLSFPSGGGPTDRPTERSLACFHLFPNCS